MGTAVLEALAGAYDELRARLRFRPDDPITVVLEMGNSFQDDGRPGMGGRRQRRRHPRAAARPGAALRRSGGRAAPRARAFVHRARAPAATVPTWLQEGIAQWLEGGDPRREDAAVAAAARQGRLLPLLTLEAPFQSLPPERGRRSPTRRAFPRSPTSCARAAKRRRAAAGRRSATGCPSEEALPVALALSYPEFQKSWEDALGRPQRRAPWTAGRPAIPLHRPPQPRLEVDLRPIAEQPPGGGDVGQAVADVARRAAGRCSARGGDADLAAERRPGAARRRDAVAGGHVDGWPASPRALQRAQVRRRTTFVHVREVAALQPVAVDHRPLPGEERGDEEADHAAVGRARVLPRAEDVEVAQGQRLQAVEAVEDPEVVLARRASPPRRARAGCGSMSSRLGSARRSP